MVAIETAMVVEVVQMDLTLGSTVLVVVWALLQSVVASVPLAWKREEHPCH